jgi:hypothetical protein
MAIFRYFPGCAGQERVKIGSKIFSGKSLDCRKKSFSVFFLLKHGSEKKRCVKVKVLEL